MVLRAPPSEDPTWTPMEQGSRRHLVPVPSGHEDAIPGPEARPGVYRPVRHRGDDFGCRTTGRSRATPSAAAAACVPTVDADLSRCPGMGRGALDAIRRDLPRPTVHSRNLFHMSAGMWDAWAAYDPVAPRLFRDRGAPRGRQGSRPRRGHQLRRVSHPEPSVCRLGRRRGGRWPSSTRRWPHSASTRGHDHDGSATRLRRSATVSQRPSSSSG